MIIEPKLLMISRIYPPRDLSNMEIAYTDEAWPSSTPSTPPFKKFLAGKFRAAGIL